MTHPADDETTVYETTVYEGVRGLWAEGPYPEWPCATVRALKGES